MAKTLVFDLDGTLTDPAEGIVNSFQYALAQLGYPAADTADVHEGIGPPLDVTFRKLTGVQDADRLAEMVASYRERYTAGGYAENTLYPGIPDALSALAGHGIRLGVCTSKRVDFAEKILTLFDLRKYFEFVDGGDIGISKAMQLAALLDKGAIDNSAVMIGDRNVDIESARTNGLAGVGVLWGFGDRAELEAAGPVAILDTVPELAGLADP